MWWWKFSLIVRQIHNSTYLSFRLSLTILNIENVELVNNVEQKACVQSCVYFRHLLKAFASPTFNKPYPSSSHWKINYFEVYEMSFTKYKIPEKRYPFLFDGLHVKLIFHKIYSPHLSHNAYLTTMESHMMASCSTIYWSGRRKMLQ